MPKAPPAPPPKASALREAIEEQIELRAQIKQLQEREMVLRKYIAAQLFPNPKEGVNHLVRNGIEAKLTLDYKYKVLEAEYTTLRPTLLKLGVPCNRLVEMDPKLVMKEYRALTATHKKQFDRVLSIKPAETPRLDVNI